MKLTKKQTKAFDFLSDNITKEVLFGGAAGGGKSSFGVFWLIFCCLRYPGTRWLMGRKKLDTLKKTTLNSFFEVARREGLIINQHFTYTDNPKNTIEFFNGSTILLKDLAYYPSDPDFDSLGSLEITGAFIDECVQISERAKNIVKSRIRYKLDEFGIIPKTLMTCNPSKGWVYRSYYKPFKEKTLDIEKQFIQALLTDNPFISKHYAENLKTLDRIDKERLLFGNWEYDDDELSLFKYEEILQFFAPKEITKKRRFISADIARFGSDKSVIGVWYDMTLIEIHTSEKQPINVTTEKILQLAKKHNIGNGNIIVDEDGVGGGVKDNIHGCVGFVNNSKPVLARRNNYANLKTQCYYELSKIKTELYISAIINSTQKEEIIEEFEQIKRDKVDQDGRLFIESKEKIKESIGRSPDYADMIMMRVYFNLHPQQLTA